MNYPPGVTTAHIDEAFGNSDVGYKCNDCFEFFHDEDLMENEYEDKCLCPDCGGEVADFEPLDHIHDGAEREEREER